MIRTLGINQSGASLTDPLFIIQNGVDNTAVTGGFGYYTDGTITFNNPEGFAELSVYNSQTYSMKNVPLCNYSNYYISYYPVITFTGGRMDDPYLEIYAGQETKYPIDLYFTSAITGSASDLQIATGTTTSYDLGADMPFYFYGEGDWMYGSSIFIKDLFFYNDIDYTLYVS